MDNAVEAIIEGLQTDGAHHKQFALEVALIRLVGVARFEQLKKEHQWQDGMPA